MTLPVIFVHPNCKTTLYNFTIDVNQDKDDNLSEVTSSTLAGTRLERQVVTFLCPQILNSLFLAPTTSSATRPQVRQHLRLPLTETITVHPHTLITCLVVTIHLYNTTNIALLQTDWVSGNVIGLINKVILHPAGLVLRWVTIWQIHSVGI